MLIFILYEILIITGKLIDVLFCYIVLFKFALFKWWYELCSFSLNNFLVHLTQRVMWAIAITWRSSSSSVIRRKLFQKSSPLKVLDHWKPNLVWIITRVSSFKIVSGDAMHQPTWPLLLKIEHMVKLQVFGNNSKTVNNIKNLTWVKNDQHIKIYQPCKFDEKRAITPRWVFRYTSKLQGR